MRRDHVFVAKKYDPGGNQIMKIMEIEAQAIAELQLKGIFRSSYL